MARPRTPAEARQKVVGREIRALLNKSILDAAPPGWIDPRPRHERRGHGDVEWEDFLPGDDWHCDNGYTDAEFAIAWASCLAWFGSLEAVADRTRTVLPLPTGVNIQKPVAPADPLTARPEAPRAPSPARAGWSATTLLAKAA